MARKFQQKIENFVCRHCGMAVRGGGYTNHCPKCLWSRHVDINPGDREAVCGGMMEPIGIKTVGGVPRTITHQCIVCGKEKPNKISNGDNAEVIIALSKQPF
jgi:ribosomal protein L37AE/L43A